VVPLAVAVGAAAGVKTCTAADHALGDDLGCGDWLVAEGHSGLSTLTIYTQPHDEDR
jgi:hypothetical protein